MARAPKPPMEEWLVPHRSQDDRSRMSSIGNVVVPAMAYMAAHMLAFDTGL